MRETLEEFCVRFGIHFEEKPQPIRGSQWTWLVRDVSGRHWVVKSRPSHDASGEFLKKLAVLHGPFLCPQPASDPEDSFVLYPYIEGQILADGLFEQAELVKRVEEIAGRVQAMMRSLILVPFYQEMIQLKDPGTKESFPIVDRFSAERVELASMENKQARQREIADSFRWMHERLPACCAFLESRGCWPGVELDAYRETMDKAFSIHVPIVGSNLAHCAFHPEHLILCPDGGIAVVGWHVESRPRFYMKYTNWAWSFLHSKRSDLLDYYQKLLVGEMTGAFQRERSQVLSFCIMEQFVDIYRNEGEKGREVASERAAHSEALFLECTRNMMGS